MDGPAANGTNGTIEAGEFRLVVDPNGDGWSGRVETWYNGNWGTVCNDNFDENNQAARVFCKSLGLPSSDAYYVGAWEQGTDEIVMDNV